MLASRPMAPLFSEIVGVFRELLKSLIVELRKYYKVRILFVVTGHLRGQKKREGKNTDVRAMVSVSWARSPQRS